MEWQDELEVVVLMLDNGVLDLASDFSVIRRSSLLGETTDEVRAEYSLLAPGRGRP
jgi:hypothetical protein